VPRIIWNTPKKYLSKGKIGEHSGAHCLYTRLEENLISRSDNSTAAYTMKKSVALATSLSCVLMAWIALLSPIAYSASFSKHDFTLTATGQAYDRSHGFAVRTVALSTSGIAYVKLPKLLNLFVKSGDLNVAHYGDFAVLTGTGLIVQNCHFIHLIIKIAPLYGGKVAVWDFRGRTGQISGNTIPVLFFSSRVVLPLLGYPKLYGLTLTGAITLS
jgi:hypothetical protein